MPLQKMSLEFQLDAQQLKEEEMKNFYATCEISTEFYSSIFSHVLQAKYSEIKGNRCPNCGRDTNQRNLPHPSRSGSSASKKSISPGHGICHQCGGLEAGLLDGI